MPIKSQQQRAIAKPNDGVGLTRYCLYKRAWKQIGLATQNGYYLEAIALLESLLTDRMESRASYLKGEIVGFQNLGPLLRMLRDHENVEDFRVLLPLIDAWRIRRNAAVHEMVKFHDGHRPTWAEKIAPLPEIVKEGKCLLRDSDAVDKRERRSNGVRRAATEPAAFA